jgi:DNA processing protein
VRTLSDSERHAWVRLARTEHVGPVTFAGLIARFGGAVAALAELPRMAARGGLAKNFILPPEEDVAREIADLAKLGGRLKAWRRSIRRRP